MKNNKTIFIACDTSDERRLKKIISVTKKSKLKIGYKIGLEFFYSKNGRRFLSKIKNKNIFLDLKLNDIPNTCVSAIRAIRDLKNINYITAHINSGQETLNAIRKEVKKRYKILGVTVLTSINNFYLKKLGYEKTVEKIVIHQARVAKTLRLDGIVCSGQEIEKIKNICKKMEIIVPGIRLKGDLVQDQKRVMTPKEAFKAGATAIVIGRSLTQGNIENNFKKLMKSLD
tara:strand:- start:196 stop:882 length:687 start_codon:yes stop_codon:yes gene_type:complete